MSQLVFKFPFKTKYYEQDYYVSSNNFAAYRLIESWPNWPDKWVNIYGPKGCGKTHLSNILKKKISVIEIFDAKKISLTTDLPRSFGMTSLFPHNKISQIYLYNWNLSSQQLLIPSQQTF